LRAVSPRTSAFAALCACIALTLVACGDDEKPATTTTDPTATTTTTTAEPAEPTAERRRLERYIRRALRAEGATGTVETDCVIAELRRTLSNEAVANAAEAIDVGEDVPRAAVDAAFEAGERCRRAD
jgi:hypothetical protein